MALILIPCLMTQKARCASGPRLDARCPAQVRYRDGARAQFDRAIAQLRDQRGHERGVMIVGADVVQP
jgi:phage baseplate assembly protein gpV